MVAFDLRRGTWKIQNANAGHLRRKGLSRALHAVPGILQRPAASRCAFEADRLPRRRPLDPEAAKRATLVPDLLWLALHLPAIKTLVETAFRSGPLFTFPGR